MAFARGPAISSSPIQLCGTIKRRDEPNVGAPFGIAHQSPLLLIARPRCIARQTLAKSLTSCIATQRRPLSRESFQKGRRRGFGTSLPGEKRSAGITVSSLGASFVCEPSVELPDASKTLSTEALNFEDECAPTMQSQNERLNQESSAQSVNKASRQETVTRKAEDRKAESWVPRRLGEAAVHFLKQPSVLLSLAAIAAVAAVRSRFPWRLADGPVILIMAAWWAFFEWFLHAKLLHSDYNWFGRGIHKRHHEAPFHHVSIDGLDLVAVSLVGFAAFCFALFGKSPLALTGTLTVYSMGLLYEWTHYLVHTKVPMRSYLGSMIKRAHVSHHLKDQRYWLSFTCPAIDVLMGTTPQGGQGVTPVT